MRKKVFTRILPGLLLCISTFSFSFAQQKTITGIISDQHGAPLVNATVRVKGEKTSAMMIPKHCILTTYSWLNK